MRKFNIEINIRISNEQIKSIATDFLNYLGRVNPQNIKKLSTRKRINNNMSPMDYVKLGKQNLRFMVGKTKVSTNMINNIFAISFIKDLDKGIKRLKVIFYDKKSLDVFKKAAVFVEAYKNSAGPSPLSQVPNAFSNVLNTDQAKAVAPAHVYACYQEYNSDQLINEIVRECLKKILKEFDNYA